MQVIDELTIYAVDCVDPQQLSLINPVQSTHHLRSHVVSCTGRVIKVMMFFLHGPLFFVFVTRMMPYRPIIHRHLVPGLFSLFADVCHGCHPGSCNILHSRQQ